MTTLTDFGKAKHLVNSHSGYALEAAIADALAAERERLRAILTRAKTDLEAGAETLGTDAGFFSRAKDFLETAYQIEQALANGQAAVKGWKDDPGM